jgi:hypothetical protein
MLLAKEAITDKMKDTESQPFRTPLDHAGWREDDTANGHNFRYIDSIYQPLTQALPRPVNNIPFIVQTDKKSSQVRGSVDKSLVYKAGGYSPDFDFTRARKEVLFTLNLMLPSIHP